jgi:hypothetical protein
VEVSAMTRRTSTNGRHAGQTIDPSRAWILGLTVGTDGRLEGPALGEAQDEAWSVWPATASAGTCTCPDDCLRDHPNE